MSRDYEAGYRDGSIHYELEHCPACKNVADLQEVLEENAKLREQMERLVTLLRADCDIEASWDGLRKFWSIGLTEDGCLMRDRACKAEAENAKLRELVRDVWHLFTEHGAVNPCDLPVVDAVRDRMRELGMDVWSCTPEQAIAATLGATDAKPTQVESSGTCEADETDTWECVRDDLGGYGKTMTVHVMECTECGHTYEHVNGDYEYCPRCGRKREDVSE